MLKIALRSINFFLDKRLLKVRLIALYNGVWFSALLRIDRVLIDLAIGVADTIHTTTLAKSILTVIKKLEENMNSTRSRALNSSGFSLARKLGLITNRWGNTFAKKWAFDLSFRRFLVVLHINDPRYSKTNKSYQRRY